MNTVSKWFVCAVLLTGTFAFAEDLTLDRESSALLNNSLSVEATVASGPVEGGIKTQVPGPVTVHVLVKKAGNATCNQVIEIDDAGKTLSDEAYCKISVDLKTGKLQPAPQPIK